MQDSAARMRLTVCTRLDGKWVGKVARLVDGRITRTAEGKAHPDAFEVVEVAPGPAWTDLVKSLGPHQFVVAGIPKDGREQGSIRLQAAPSSEGVALSNADFEWPAGPGLMLLDFDPKTAEEGWLPAQPSPDKPMAVVAALNSAGRMLGRHSTMAPSSSSFLSLAADGSANTGARGWHFAIGVLDATDIPRAGGVLAQRLILLGQGFPFVTKSGAIQVRTIVDTAVWRPSHPLFVGGVKCARGIQQDRHSHIAAGPAAETLVDTRSLLPDLTSEEAERYERECARLRELGAPLAAERRREFIARRAEQAAARIAERESLTLEAAKARALLAAQGEVAEVAQDGSIRRTLAPDAMIETERGAVTVADILSAPSDWDRVRCLDPDEPEYGAMGVAMIHTRDGRPIVHSFAHGKTIYFLGDRATADFWQFDVDHDPDTGPEACEAGQPIGLERDATEGRSGGLGDNEATAPARKSKRVLPGASGVRSAVDLLALEFPPVEWAVEGILPVGCWTLAGKSKTGKSWLALALQLATVTDGTFLGRKVRGGPCLYLALEDNDRRLQDRIRKLGARLTPETATRLNLQTAWPKDEACFTELRKYLDANPGTRMVVVDTLVKVKKSAGRNATAYDADYAAIGPFQDLANEYGLTVLLLTHMRKTVTDDTFDDITGSAAMMGATDGAMILRRMKGDPQRLELLLRGRDLDGDQEHVIEHVEGAGFRAVSEDDLLAPARREVLEHLRLLRDGGEPEGATAAEIQRALGRTDTRATTRLLDRMCTDFMLCRNGRRFALPDDDVPHTAGAHTARPR